VILTKIDTDPKGGIAISILNDLKKPIFYIGTGQEYKDLMPFSPQFIIKRIVE
jgi:fused signal recognition particle receptor